MKLKGKITMRDLENHMVMYANEVNHDYFLDDDEVVTDDLDWDDEDENWDDKEEDDDVFIYHLLDGDCGW